MNRKKGGVPVAQRVISRYPPKREQLLHLPVRIRNRITRVSGTIDGMLVVAWNKKEDYGGRIKIARTLHELRNDKYVYKVRGGKRFGLYVELPRVKGNLRVIVIIKGEF
jgi:hypothetical protein